MTKFTKLMTKAIIAVAKKAAIAEANSTCPLIAYQSKMPESVKKLRKF